MPRYRRTVRLFYGLLTAFVLVVGQYAAACHTGDHEDGTFSSPSCAACVTAHLLSSACIDTGPRPVPQAQPLRIVAAAEIPSTSVDLHDPRQRGPPLAA